MKKYLNKIISLPLFYNINEDQILNILKSSNSSIKSYQKDEYIWMFGKSSDYIGIILSGTALIVKEDFEGNRTIMSKIHEGDIFGETFAFANTKTIPVSVLSSTICEILTINYKILINGPLFDCSVHNQLIKNMLFIISNKNINLNRKIEHISKRNTKDKLMSYLLEQAQIHNSNKFSIRFNRQELADYLCVDRSAMSKELCKLRDNGILKFNKNNFEILNYM